MIEFIVPGQPVAKGRPRFARRGKGVVAYTPAKTAAYEALVREAATVAMSGRPPAAGPLKLVLSLTLQVPLTWSKKRRALAIDGHIRATKKPDADNVLKGLKDGCNGIVWIDDAQVVCIELTKAYGSQPHAAVRILEVPGEAA
ncbi:RusA family crossover junction endodeoxyribonuclease [Massilia sp. TN1-12]|uniref:RusA family crossover junction endodeoxyribonuclease n=1 Tax=Massilia paldalensis TaxID=3377675 RepID=UPI00384F5758